MSSRAAKKQNQNQPLSFRSAERASAWRKLCSETVSPLMCEPWTPFEQAEIPGAEHIECYVNSRYQVQVARDGGKGSPFGPCVWLSIKLLDKLAGHDWRDFQRIKNELVGEEAEAVEIYPAESRLVDTANQYHLWCFPKFKFPFGFRERVVSEASLKIPGHGPSKQRPF